MRLFLIFAVVLVLGLAGAMFAIDWSSLSGGFSFGGSTGGSGELVRFESVTRRTLVERVAAV